MNRNPVIRHRSTTSVDAPAIPQVSRDLLLDLAGKVHVRRMYELIAENRATGIHYNKICNELGVSKATAHAFLYAMKDAHVIESGIEQVVTGEKRTSKNLVRPAKRWGMVFRPADTPERREFERILYGDRR